MTSSFLFSWLRVFNSDAWDKILYSLLIPGEDLHSEHSRHHALSILGSIHWLWQELVRDAVFFSSYSFCSFVTYSWGLFCRFSFCLISFVELTPGPVTWLTIASTFWVLFVFLDSDLVQRTVSSYLHWPHKLHMWNLKGKRRVKSKSLQNKHLDEDLRREKIP